MFDSRSRILGMLHIIIGIWRKYWLITLIIELVGCPFHTITKKDCIQNTIGNVKCTDCTQKNAATKQIDIESFPADLGTDTTCLFTTNFLMAKIGSEAFQKYPSLTHLYLIRNGFDEFAKNTLDPLKRLLYLNMTDTNWFENTEITWPTSLRILDVTRLRINTLVAPDLNLLEVVNVSGTGITEFPTLSESAPLKLIVLHNVKMSNFKLDTLAKYCKLQSLSTLNFTLGDNCQCLQMKSWLEKFNIKIIHELNCKADANCKVEFSETSLKNREHCLSKNSYGHFIIIGGVVIALLILILAGASYLYEKLLKEEEEEGIGRTDATTQFPQTKNPEEVEEETAVDEDEETS